MVSLLGLADASYITYEKFAGVVPSCYLESIFDCGQVLSSQWSSVGPVPLSLLGMGFYATVFILATILLITPKPPAQLNKALLFLGAFGFIFSLYLTAVQAFIIGAFCFYCVLSAISSTTLFIVISTGWLLSRKRAVHD